MHFQYPTHYSNQIGYIWLQNSWEVILLRYANIWRSCEIFFNMLFSQLTPPQTIYVPPVQNLEYISPIELHDPRFSATTEHRWEGEELKPLTKRHRFAFWVAISTWILMRIELLWKSHRYKKISRQLTDFDGVANRRFHVLVRKLFCSIVVDWKIGNHETIRVSFGYNKISRGFTQIWIFVFVCDNFQRDQSDEITGNRAKVAVGPHPNWIIHPI